MSDKAGIENCLSIYYQKYIFASLKQLLNLPSHQFPSNINLIELLLR